MVGDDFEQRVFNTKRDVLMLIYHPQSHKNRGLKQKFEHFAEATEAGMTGLKDV